MTARKKFSMSSIRGQRDFDSEITLIPNISKELSYYPNFVLFKEWEVCEGYSGCVES